jgi:hypothetical protein
MLRLAVQQALAHRIVAPPLVHAAHLISSLGPTGGLHPPLRILGNRSRGLTPTIVHSHVSYHQNQESRSRYLTMSTLHAPRRIRECVALPRQHQIGNAFDSISHRAANEKSRSAPRPNVRNQIWYRPLEDGTIRAGFSAWAAKLATIPNKRRGGISG